MVLAELASCVALRLQQFSDGRVFFWESDSRSGHTDLGQAGADRILTGDKAGTASGAALLRVVIGESHPFLRHPVDVWSLVAHHAATKVADVQNADVITPKNQDVWFFCCHDFLLTFPVAFRIVKLAPPPVGAS